MFWKTCVTIFIKLSLCGVDAGTGYQNFWTLVQPDDILQGVANLEIAGKVPFLVSGGSVVYLCRQWLQNEGTNSGRWLTGMLLFQTYYNNLVCSGADETGTHNMYFFADVIKKSHLQVLKAPTGATAWIPFSAGGSLPEYFVHGGTLQSAPTNALAVCRIRDDEKNVFVGIYDVTKKKCIFSYYGYRESDKNMEVLGITLQGRKLL